MQQPLHPLLLMKENESRLVVSDSFWPNGLYSPWNSPGQNTGVGSFSLLQGIFPTQGLNPGLPHCRQILHQLSPREAQNNTGVCRLSLLQWCFLSQEWNWGLLHCRWIFYQLSYQRITPNLHGVCFSLQKKKKAFQQNLNFKGQNTNSIYIYL